MEPPSFDLSPAFEYVDDIKLPLTELGPSFSSAPKFSQRIIPPTTYQLQHDGCSNNARVWALPPSASFKNPQRKSSSLITDASPTFNPITAMFRNSGSSSKDVSGDEDFPKFHVIDPVETPPTHRIRKVTGRTYALFEGPGNHDQHSNARKIMDFQTECEEAMSLSDKRRTLLTKLSVLQLALNRSPPTPRPTGLLSMRSCREWKA